MSPASAPIPRRHATAWAALLCLVTIVVVVAALARLRGARPMPDRPVSGWAAAATPDTARARLDTLVVVEPSPEIAYDRTRDFGPAWHDVDGNGCDTRNDILARDLDAVTFEPGTGSCVVAGGGLVDPYTGNQLVFSRSDASAVQIDHLVPLHAAWTLGAWAWDRTRRLAFANDPRNLVAVDGPTNMAKSDLLADRWRPPDERIHCVYAINTVEVHAAYELGLTGSERRALAAMLRRCP